MKKYFLMMVLMVMGAVCVDAQISFSKFKFFKGGTMPGRKSTDSKFTITGDRTVKYMEVWYCGVNRVGDAVTSDIYGGVNANAKRTKNRILRCTGPFEPGKTYSRWASGTFYHAEKDIKAFPRFVVMTYQDGVTDTLRVTKESIGRLFPCLTWREVDYESGF